MSKMESVRSICSAFLTVLLWLLVLVRVDAQIRVEEVQALTTFRRATFVPQYFSNFSNWNEKDENACSWVGITCTANSTVAALDLSGWGIAPRGFAALSKLPDLRQLDLSSNPVGSWSFQNMEDDIGSLTQLTRLDLSSNLFFSISPNISNCRSLRYLSLERNYMYGAIPDLSELVHLQILLLAGNHLNGSFPRELGKLSSLVTIDVSGNGLSGLIPSFGNSTNLESLLLANNTFVGFEEPFSLHAPNLQQLDVAENALEGMIPLAITDLPTLGLLNMSRNWLSGQIPAGLFNVTHPSEFTFDLSQNRLSGSIPLDLLQSVGAVYVDINISYNLLSGTIPSVASGKRLVDLDLSHNQLTGPIPSQLNGTSYRVLNLENNLLSGDIVDVLIGSQAFGGETLPTGASQVFLGNNHLTGDLTRLTFHWANWSDLIVIDLSNNNLSWRASESIPDPLSAALSRFPEYLTEFRVRGNNFSGTSLPRSPLPHNLSLQILDFSDNQLQGVVSGAVFNPMSMPGVFYLNLSNNFAKGPIPDNITRLPLLAILDLSNNKLSGSIPSIPLNSRLINPSFFLGNDGLCGYPLPQCPQLSPRHGTGVKLWVLLTSIGGSIMMVVGSCLVVTWRWRVFRKRHEQDADLIRTLMERELVTLMPLHTLKKATNNFAESARIGEGGFGTVYIGKLNDGTSVAIKRSKREGSEKDKEQFLNEVRILSQVNHRHLVKLMGCCMENKVALLVFELVSNGNLQDHLQGKIGDGCLSWKQRLDIAVQTADALNYLHSATTFPIYHRDVKSANILLNDDLSAKVADFGISKLAPMNATHVSTILQGTMGYIDPEYWVSFQLTEKSDVYSFGVVLLELISAKLAVDFQRGEDKTSLVIFASTHIDGGDLHALIDPNLMGTYSEKSGHGSESILEVGRLAMKCLNMQSKLRPSMNEVWKELQDLCLNFNGRFMNEDLGSLNKNDNENPQVDHKALLSQLSFGYSSSYVMEYDARSLEMAQFSSPPSFG